MGRAGVCGGTGAGSAATIVAPPPFSFFKRRARQWHAGRAGRAGVRGAGPPGRGLAGRHSGRGRVRRTVHEGHGLQERPGRRRREVQGLRRDDGQNRRRADRRGDGRLTPFSVLVGKTIGRAENIGDVADVFGLSAESASKFASAFELAGGSIDELEMSLAKLAKANVDGKPLDQFFLDTAKAIGDIDDATERYAAASDIFGEKFAKKFLDNGLDVPACSRRRRPFRRTTSPTPKRSAWSGRGSASRSKTRCSGAPSPQPFIQKAGQLVTAYAPVLPVVGAVAAGVGALGVGLVAAGRDDRHVGHPGGPERRRGGRPLARGPRHRRPRRRGAGVGELHDLGAASPRGRGRSRRHDAGRFAESWANITDAFEAEGLPLALKATKAELEFVWAELTTTLSSAWAKMLGTMKEALNAWRFAVRTCSPRVTGSLALGMSAVAERLGLADPGTTREVNRDNRNDLKRIRKRPSPSRDASPPRRTPPSPPRKNGSTTPGPPSPGCGPR